jgi:signal transduction histidine kinase
MTSLKKEINFLNATQNQTENFLSDQKISELEESLKMRDEFLSVASHELRTPITRILMGLGLMKKNNQIHDEKFLKYFKICEDSTQELITLMDNLMDVSRLRTGKLEIKRTKTNITNLMLNVLDNFKDPIRLNDNNVVFSHGGDIIGYWDQTRISQLFTHLVSNAVKYAPGKSIKIDLFQKDQNVFYEITDDGPGIPYQLQSKIFERFERASDYKRASGLGLGLYVSKQIVLAHNGEINLKSHPGKGTSFQVVLPIKQLYKKI